MLHFNDKLVTITLDGELLTIAGLNNELLVTIKYQHVLTVCTDSSKLLIHHVIKKKDGTLKQKILTILGSPEDLEQLQLDIENSILKDRPKRLLVIINPNSGKRKGIKVYQKYVAPLFQLYDVQADVFVTSKPKEPTEILQNYNLSQIDGVVAVGGDGIFCECMNGLVTRVQRDHKKDVHSHTTDIDPVSLPLGIIPAGSGDVILQYLHGTRCARTAALHILLGNSIDTNIASVHESDKLLSYSALVLGFGLFGDMMYQCERFRWMGPSRYNIIPLGCMMKRKEFDVEVEYYPSEKKTSPIKQRCYGRQISLPNGVLSKQTVSKLQRPKSTSDLLKDVTDCLKEEGRVYAVDTHPIMMKEKEGRMTPHFGQNHLMVYTTHKCTLSDHISQLTKVKNEKPDCYDYKFVSQHKVSGYRVKLQNTTLVTSGNKSCLQKDYYINCDGEVIRLTEPSFSVKLHQKAVKLFGDVAG